MTEITAQNAYPATQAERVAAGKLTAARGFRDNLLRDVENFQTRLANAERAGARGLPGVVDGLRGHLKEALEALQEHVAKFPDL